LTSRRLLALLTKDHQLMSFGLNQLLRYRYYRHLLLVPSW
jgi:hypothetical protein